MQELKCETCGRPTSYTRCNNCENNYCYVCGGKGVRAYTKSERSKYFICSNCNIVVTPERKIRYCTVCDKKAQYSHNKQYFCQEHLDMEPVYDKDGQIIDGYYFKNRKLKKRT